MTIITFEIFDSPLRVLVTIKFKIEHIEHINSLSLQIRLPQTMFNCLNNKIKEEGWASYPSQPPCIYIYNPTRIPPGFLATKPTKPWMTSGSTMIPLRIPVKQIPQTSAADVPSYLTGQSPAIRHICRHRLCLLLKSYSIALSGTLHNWRVCINNTNKTPEQCGRSVIKVLEALKLWRPYS